MSWLWRNPLVETLAAFFAMLWAPGRVMAECRLGQWLPVLAVALLMQVLFTRFTWEIVDMGAVLHQQVSSRPGNSNAATAQAVDRFVEEQYSLSGRIMRALGAAVYLVIGTLLTAGVLFLLAAMAGASPVFKMVFTVCVYATWGYVFVECAGGALVLLLRGDSSVPELGNLVKLNPTLFLDRARTSKQLYSLATSLDLVNLWQYFLMGLGLSKVCPRLSLAKGLGIAAATGGAWALVRMGLAAAF